MRQWYFHAAKAKRAGAASEWRRVPRRHLSPIISMDVGVTFIYHPHTFHPLAPPRRRGTAISIMLTRTRAINNRYHDIWWMASCRLHLLGFWTISSKTKTTFRRCVPFPMYLCLISVFFCFQNQRKTNWKMVGSWWGPSGRTLWQQENTRGGYAIKVT